MTNYEKIKNDMSMKDVQAILGKGEEQSSSDVSVPGMSIGDVSMPGISMSGKTVMWKDNMCIITVMFMNDKVMSKAQIGL